MSARLNADLEDFVRLQGGTVVHTWTKPAQAGVHALVVCTNDVGSGLVVGVMAGRDGAVVTLPLNDAHALAAAIAEWSGDHP